MSKNWFVILVVVAGTAVLIAAILRYLTPQNQPIPASSFVTANLDGSQTNFSNVTFTGSTPEFPTQLSIAQVQTGASNLAQTLATVYNLQTLGGDFWQGEQYSMSYVEQAGLYNLSVNTHEESLEAQVVDVAAARQVAENFVAQYLPNQSLSIIESEISYFLDEDLRPAEATTARFVDFPFSYQVDGFPVKASTLSIEPISILVNHDLAVQKVSFLPQTYVIQTVDSKPLISVAKALENLNQDQGSVTAAFQDDFQAMDITALAQVTLSAVTLEYRIDEVLKIAYPFYHFTGVARDMDGVNFNIEVVTPAVASTPQ